MKLPYKYIETEPYEKGFAEYYEKNIVPLSQQKESLRHSKRKLNAYIIALTLAIGTISAVAIFMSDWFTEMKY